MHAHGKRLRARLASFNIIGMAVMGYGFALTWLLVGVLGVADMVAYCLQAVTSALLNFALNRRFTWGDRRVGARTAIARHLAFRAFTVPLGVALFWVLAHWLGAWYLFAQALTIVIIAAVSYAVGDRWVFRERHK